MTEGATGRLFAGLELAALEQIEAHLPGRNAHVADLAFDPQTAGRDLHHLARVLAQLHRLGRAREPKPDRDDVAARRQGEDRVGALVFPDDAEDAGLGPACSETPAKQPAADRGHVAAIAGADGERHLSRAGWPACSGPAGTRRRQRPARVAAADRGCNAAIRRRQILRAQRGSRRHIGRRPRYSRGPRRMADAGPGIAESAAAASHKAATTRGPPRRVLVPPILIGRHFATEITAISSQRPVCLARGPMLGATGIQGIYPCPRLSTSSKPADLSRRSNSPARRRPGGDRHHPDRRLPRARSRQAHPLALHRVRGRGPPRGRRGHRGGVPGQISRRQARERRYERSRLARAPLVIAVVSRAAPHVKIPEWEQVLSAGAAAMSLVLAAHALGYGASWITEWYAYDRRVLDALGLAPHEKIAGFVHIGRAARPGGRSSAPAAGGDRDPVRSG